MSSDLPIGVFDSGVGGLTVAKEIMKHLPRESIIYFGDTARVPYGSKSKETVTMYSRQIIHFLLSKKVKAIVIACNTASAYALEEVRKEFDVPIIGVVKPGAFAAANATINGNIGIIGTEGTIKSGIYPEFLSALGDDLHVYQKACPLFVPLVEEGWIDDPVTREVATRYISELIRRKIDTLVMGCTHYPLLRNTICGIVGEDVTLVDPAHETARTLMDVLKSHDLMSETDHGTEHRFFVSDGAEKFRKFANTILPCDIIETKDVNIKTFD